MAQYIKPLLCFRKTGIAGFTCGFYRAVLTVISIFAMFHTPANFAAFNAFITKLAMFG